MTRNEKKFTKMESIWVKKHYKLKSKNGRIPLKYLSYLP